MDRTWKNAQELSNIGGELGPVGESLRRAFIEYLEPGGSNVDAVMEHIQHARMKLRELDARLGAWRG
jgi:hypothetical protein